MSSVLRKTLPAALALLLVLATGASAADPAPSLSNVATARNAAGQLQVTGRASFASPAVQLATDGAGDPLVDRIGMDLVGATIGQPDSKTLAFRFLVGDMPPVVNGTHQAVYYNWNIAVINGSNTSNYNVQAIRSDAYSVAAYGAAPGEPVFRLQTCTPNPTTGGQSCSVAASLTGTFATDHVEVLVPLGVIGARSGSVIDVGAQPINANLGAGAVWYNGSTSWGDAIGFWDPYTVTNTVHVGTGAPGTPAENIAATTPATVSSSGAFTALLDAVESGSTVVVEACAADLCVTSSTVAP